MRRWVIGRRMKSILGQRRSWRRPRRPWFDMDRAEIAVPRASGEAVFLRFDLKWLLDLGMAKMRMNGGPQIHLQKAQKLSKEWGEGHAAQEAFFHDYVAFYNGFSQEGQRMHE